MWDAEVATTTMSDSKVTATNMLDSEVIQRNYFRKREVDATESERYQLYAY